MIHIENIFDKEIEKKIPIVMIVDDDPFIQLTLGTLLKKLGCKVDKASNGRISVSMVNEKLLQGKEYDLIFMDANMPIMSGYEEALEITKNVKVKTLIICVSAQDSIQHKKKCEDCGMSGILTKPCSIMDLKEILEKFNLI